MIKEHDAVVEKKREFHLVIFGATGFTGLRIAKYLFNLRKTTIHGTEPLRWAIAGRSEAKLNKVLQDLTQGTVAAKGVPNLPKIITADCQDEASLNNMCKRSVLIISAVGPYRFTILSPIIP